MGIVRRHQNDIPATTGNLEESTLRSYLSSTAANIAANIAYIVGIYIFLNLPVLVVTTYHQEVHRNLSSYNYYGWAETVELLNSCLNSLVCCWRARNLRKAIVKEITPWVP